MESVHAHAKDAADRRRRGRESCVLAVGLIGKGQPLDDQGLRCLEKLVGRYGLDIKSLFSGVTRCELKVARAVSVTSDRTTSPACAEIGASMAKARERPFRSSSSVQADCGLSRGSVVVDLVMAFRASSPCRYDELRRR